MSETRSDAALPPSTPRRRGRFARVLGILLALAIAALAGMAAWLGFGPTWWSVRASTSPASDTAAWSRIPAQAQVVAICDVRDLLDSPVGRSVRPQLEQLSSRYGLDLALAERNVDELVATADARGRGFAIGTGFRMSPLMLARFAPRWSIVTLPGPSGTTWTAATDGATTLVPLEPGIVAWRPEAVPHDAVLASLEAATTAPHEPLALDGKALRLVVVVDDEVRAALSSLTSRIGGAAPRGLVRVEAGLEATDRLTGDVRLVHSDPSSATGLVTALRNLEAARQVGLFSLMGGPQATLLSRLPAVAIAQEGSDVTLRVTLSQDDVRGFLDDLLALR